MHINNGTRSEAQSFNNPVGIGYCSYCLFGAYAIKWHRSLTDVKVKACSSLVDFDVIGGEGAVAVDARIFFTSMKNMAK